VDGFANADVSAATTEVAAHAFAELVVGKFERGAAIFGDGAGGALAKFIEHANGGANLAGRAVAALETVVGDEGLLKGVEFAGFFEAFDGGDVATFVLHGESEAGVNALTVDEDGAGTAGALVASFFGTGKLKMIAESIEEGDAGFDSQNLFDTIYVQSDALQAVWRIAHAYTSGVMVI